MVLPERVITAATFDESLLEQGVDTYLAGQEAAFADLLPGVAKRVIWHGAPETPTAMSVLYVHGFSATSEEIRPLPDLVARALSANLVFTRLAGHGRSGDAMGRASASAWMQDMAEALAVARAVGDRVLVISCSTGGTLTALALREEMARGVAGSVFVSPNFKVRDASSHVLTWPGARWFVPLLAGRDRVNTPRNDRHAQFTAMRYPMVSVLPMAAAVKAAARLRYEDMTVPALFVLDEADEVVDAGQTRRIAARWGGPMREMLVSVGEGDDPSHHVIAGDILSPSMTDGMARGIVDWVRTEIEGV